MNKILAVFLFAVVWVSNSAQADFGDCNDPDYLGRFGSVEAGLSPLGPIRQLNCVVEFEFSFETPGGTRRARGIRDISSDWVIEPVTLARLERGARRAAEAAALLGNYRIGDVTILMLDDAYETADLTHTSGYTGAVTSGQSTDQECIVTSYLLGRAGEGERVAYNVAHEFFHCIQEASLSPEQNATATAGGTWWAEGSAEYFAGLALPDLGDIYNRANLFNRSVEGNEPLNQQNYGMAVFFYWFHGRFGPGELMTFLSGMAASPGAEAQQDAMRAAMSDTEWLQFAQDYSDRNITHPSGSALALNPPGGEVLVFNGNVTRTLSIGPFTIRLGTAEYDCGRWENTLTPDTGLVSAQPITGGAWSDYPDEVDARDRAGSSYRIAALPTGSERRVRIRADHREACAPCAGSRTVDSCLVGRWEMSGGGPVEWMRARGMPPELIIDPGRQVIVLEDDGTYWTVPFNNSIQGIFTRRDDVTVVYGRARAAAAGGRWSAGGGQLAICQDSGGVNGSVTLTSRGGTGTMPIAVPGGGGVLQNTYSCNETSMQTTMEMPGGSPMVTQYSKIIVEEAVEPETDPPDEPASSDEPAGPGGGCPVEDPDPEVEDECDRFRR